jgi:hypothetical protein
LKVIGSVAKSLVAGELSVRPLCFSLEESNPTITLFRLVLPKDYSHTSMNTITYRLPQIGDEPQISGCMWASAVLWELTDGTPESVAEWLQICHPEELRDRILSDEKTLVLDGLSKSTV